MSSRTPEQIRRRANRLRNVPLESVLRLRGARPDRHDSHKWHTPERGTLSVTGAKFFNWKCGTGGGGAIDLVIHLEGGCSFREALDWLHRHFAPELLLEEPSQSLAPSAQCGKSGLVLPPPHPSHLARVRSYLVTQRAIAPALIDALVHAGSLYADSRANAVFLLLGGDATAVGAELRGTGPVPWRGMAPGSRKDKGFFSVPAHPAAAEDDPPTIVLCESAIDAISCFALHPDHWCISTSGARPNPAWLPALIDQSASRPIYCGFDADDTGDAMARAMIAFHPEVRRLRPARHDWNAMLMSAA